MSWPRVHRKKLALLAAKLLALGLVLWGVRGMLAEALTRLDERLGELDPRWLVAAGLLYLLGICSSGLFWHRLMNHLGGRPTLVDSLRAYYIGHLGKYVPGKAMVVILRAGMVRGPRVSTSLAAITVFYETLTTMAVGSFLAAAIIGLWFRDDGRLVAFALGLMVLSGVPTWPPIAWRIARLLQVGRADPELLDRLARLNLRTLAYGWCLLLAGWLLLGLSLFATLRAMGVAADVQDVPRYTASVALAMVLGFVSFIPGGLGVRDGALVQLLAPTFEQDAATRAVLAAVLLRLVWVVAELLISGILYWMGSKPSGERAASAAVESRPSLPGPPLERQGR